MKKSLCFLLLWPIEYFADPIHPPQSLVFFRSDTGRSFAFGNTFFLKLRPGTPIDLLTDEYNLTIRKRYGDRLFLMETNDSEPMGLVSRLDKSEGVEYAWPNVYKKIDKR